jgi:hypothetical protein
MRLVEALKGMVSPEELTQLATLMNQTTYDSAIENIAAAGALSVSKRNSLLAVDGTTAYTLADGTFVGQRKTCTVISGANTPLGTITPAHPSGFATVTALGAKGDSVEFMWTGAAWIITSSQGVTIT